MDYRRRLIGDYQQLWYEAILDCARFRRTALLIAREKNKPADLNIERSIEAYRVARWARRQLAIMGVKHGYVNPCRVPRYRERYPRSIVEIGGK